MYLATEYCAPIWINNTHTNKLDIQLNSVMRIIGSVLKYTAVKLLPVLRNFTPPKIRREQALIREWVKVTNNPNFPINIDLRTSSKYTLTQVKKTTMDYRKQILTGNCQGY